MEGCEMNAVCVRLTRVFLILSLFLAAMAAPMVLADEEPNDTFAQAEEVWSGDQINGILSSNNDYDDYYKIYLYESDELTAILTGNVGDFDLYLYDEEGYELTSSMNDDSNEEISYTTSYDGWFYIDCWAYDGNGAYTLSVSVHYISYDEKATEITADAPVTDTFNWVTDPERIYKIDLKEGDKLTVTLTSNTGDIDLYLYDPEEEYIDSSDEGGSNEMLEYEVEETGTYYIYLWAYDGSGQFTLEVEVESPGFIQQPWFWMLVILVVVIVVVILVAAKVISRPKEGDEMFGAPSTPPPPPAPVQMPEQHEQSMEQTYCENCQKVIPSDAVICPYCGTNPFERTY